MQSKKTDILKSDAAIKCDQHEWKKDESTLQHPYENWGKLSEKIQLKRKMTKTWISLKMIYEMNYNTFVKKTATVEIQFGFTRFWVDLYTNAIEKNRTNDLNNNSIKIEFFIDHNAPLHMCLRIIKWSKMYKKRRPVKKRHTKNLKFDIVLTMNSKSETFCRKRIKRIKTTPYHYDRNRKWKTKRCTQIYRKKLTNFTQQHQNLQSKYK